LASYAEGDVIAALRLWRTQPQQPKTLPELALVAEGLASEGDHSSGIYINQLADVLPTDAQAIRAELLRRQGKAVEAVKTLGAFLLALRSDPWPDQGLIRRSLVRDETLASEDASMERARFLYDVLKKPFAVCNCETDRRLRLVMLAMHLDGKTAGKYTASALAPFEPNVMWERTFLQIRSDCYNSISSPRADKAKRDLEEFMNNEAFTQDVSAVTRIFGSRSWQERRDILR
jgi:hypothetical protein